MERIGEPRGMAGQRRSRSERESSVAFPLAALRERPAPPFRWFRALVLVLLALGGLAGGGVLVIASLIDKDAIHAEAQAALQAATGRAVRIGGPLEITSYYGATLVAGDIVIPNRPGAVPPDMMRIAQVEVELSLGALLAGRTEIVRMVLEQPDILLQVDEQGRGNWQNDSSGATAASAAELTAARPSPPRHIHIKDGRVTLEDARTGQNIEVTLRRASASEIDASGLLAISADVMLGSQRLSLTGQIGSFARLLDRTATSPWPFRLVLETLGARLSASGSATRPLDLAGYAVKLDASVADSDSLAGLVPVRLPALRTIVATARIADTGAGFPDIAGVRLQMGASDFGAWVPGLKLDAMEVNMPGLEQSLRGEFLGTLHGVPVRLQAALGGIAAFLADAPVRPDYFPVDITAEVGESRLTVKGAINGAATRTGLDLAVSGRVRDLELLSPLVGRRLPAMRNVAFDVRLADGPGGFGQGVALRSLSLSAPQGDIAGDLVVQYGDRPALRGTLEGTRLDADALREVLDSAIGPVSLVERGPTYRPRAWNETRIIPATPLRLGELREVDIDLSLRLGELRALGVPYRDFALRVFLADGRLDLGPVVAELAAGRASLHLTVDAQDPRTPMSLRASFPGVPIQPLLAAFSRRDNLFGVLEVEADLRAEGATPRALAASVSGHLGLALVEGDIDSRLLLDPLANIMRAARLPLNLATVRGSLSRLRCFAMRLEAEAGQTEVRALVLESGRILIQGSGGFDLAEETFAVNLRPAIRMRGLPAAVPVRLEGSFLTPRMRLDPIGLQARAGESEEEACVPALEAARGNRAGTMPRAVDARPTLVRPGPPPRRQ